MSYLNSENGVIHQFDDDANYYDDDDLITFQFESNQISFYYSHIARYSKLIRDKYLSSDVKNHFPHVLHDFKQQQNVTTENIVLFFKLLQYNFKVNQNLAYNEYRDLFKLTEFLQVKKLLINLNQYLESQNDVTDFQIQIILHELKNNTDIKNSSFQLNKAIEDLLSTKIVECLQNEKFAKIPISIVYRIIEKSDKKQISSNLLYDFIKKNVKSFFVLFCFLDIENLSDDRFEDLFNIYSDPNGSGKLYTKYLQCNLPCILKLRNDKKNTQRLIDSLTEEKNQLQSNLNQVKQSLDDDESEKNQLQSNLNQVKQSLDDAENEKNKLQSNLNQVKQSLDDTKSEKNKLKQENEEKNKKIEEIEKEYQKYMKDESIRLYDKGDYNKVNIIENKMNDDQKNYVIDITRKSLNMHKNIFECAKYITNQLESQYGGYWCVIFRARYYGDFYMTFFDNCYINFSMGEFDVCISKSSK